jgi:hypothetical protein
MESIFALVFNRLKTKLATDVPEINHINLDIGQIDFYRERPPVSFPCLLVDFSSRYLPRQINEQWNDITMILRLCFDPYSDTSNLAPTETETQGLAYFEIEHKIYQSLQFWNVNGLVKVKPFERVTANAEKRPDPFRTRQMTFNGQYEEGATLIEDDSDDTSNETTTITELTDWWTTVEGQSFVDVGTVTSSEHGYLLTADDEVKIIGRDGKVYDIVTLTPVDRQARFVTSTLHIEFDPDLVFNAGETVMLVFVRTVTS